jgi:hypothetical protein
MAEARSHSPPGRFHGYTTDMSYPSAADANTAFIMVRIFLGVTLGWAVWAMSPLVTGKIEPWDSNTLYYSGSLFIAGMLSTLFWKSGFYWGPLGIFAGQTAFLCVQDPQGGIFPAPLAVALFGTVQPIVGALIAWGVGHTLHGIYAAFRKDRAVNADGNQSADTP